MATALFDTLDGASRETKINTSIRRVQPVLGAEGPHQVRQMTGCRRRGVHIGGFLYFQSAMSLPLLRMMRS